MAHQNNFAVLRIIAAMLVLISHSWPLTGHLVDPLMAVTNNHLTGGTLGVMMFFAMSGFLVTESYLRRDSIASFFEARALRLFPALAVALAVAIFIGASVTTLSAADYFSQPQTSQYFAKNLLLDTRYELPGVFANTPYPRVVNGSLWTLPTEWFMYCIVGLLGALAILRSQAAASALFVLAIVALYVAPESVRRLPFNIPPDMTVCMQAFMVGMLFQINRGGGTHSLDCDLGGRTLCDRGVEGSPARIGAVHDHDRCFIRDLVVRAGCTDQTVSCRCMG